MIVKVYWFIKDISRINVDESLFEFFIQPVFGVKLVHAAEDVLRIVPAPVIGMDGGVDVLNSRTPVSSANSADASVLNSAMSSSVTVTVAPAWTVNVVPAS